MLGTAGLTPIPCALAGKKTDLTGNYDNVNVA